MILDINPFWLALEASIVRITRLKLGLTRIEGCEDFMYGKLEIPFARDLNIGIKTRFYYNGGAGIFHLVLNTNFPFVSHRRRHPQVLSSYYNATTLSH